MLEDEYGVGIDKCKSSSYVISRNIPECKKFI